MTSFADLGVPTALVARLAGQGITAPFPIQTATLPDSLAGRDVLGRGRTGSGKTLAFALPLVMRLAGASPSAARPAGSSPAARPAGSSPAARPAGSSSSGPRPARRRPRGLVLCPTRELANQIDAVLAPLAATLGLRTTTIFGGVSQNRQVAALDAGVDIVVACPGRLEDLLSQGLISLDAVEVTVLDEADHMADLGFLPGVTRILSRTPKVGQRLLFSATLDNGVGVLVRRFLTAPVEHSVDSAESPVAAMTHHVLAVSDAGAKGEVVRQLAGGTGRRLLFMRTKHQAKKLTKQLAAEGIAAVDLHGNLSQAARERNLAAFGSGEANVMVATDIAARGIHVDDVALVVHVDPPAEHKAYLHRSGRTARAGAAGVVVTLMLPEQRGDVRALTRAAKIAAEPRAVVPGDATVTALAGPQAPRRAVVPVTPAAAPVQRRRPAAPGTANRAPARPSRRGGRPRQGDGATAAPATRSGSTAGTVSVGGAAAFSAGRRPTAARGAGRAGARRG